MHWIIEDVVHKEHCTGELNGAADFKNQRGGRRESFSSWALRHRAESCYAEDWHDTDLFLRVQRPEAVIEDQSADIWSLRTRGLKTEPSRIRYLRTRDRVVSKTRLTGCQDR